VSNNKRTIIEFTTKIARYGNSLCLNVLASPETHIFRVAIAADMSSITAWEQIDGPMGEPAWAQISGDRLLYADHTSSVAHLPEATVIAMALLRIAGMADLGRETRYASRFIELRDLPSPPCAIAPDPA
jgi:hypothetical protein